MNIIKQVKVGNMFRLFRKDLQKKYHLMEYRYISTPCLFYGVGTPKDILIIEKHQGPKIVVFCGGDILKFKNRQDGFNINRLKKLKDIYFISISKFMTNHLKDFGLPFKYVPIAPTITSLVNYEPIKKGPCIYIYLGMDRLHIYGYRHILKILKTFKDIPFIIACNPIHYDILKRRGNIPIEGPDFKFYPYVKKLVTFRTHEDLVENAYKKSFLCLRLTSNDGNSSTVQELGLLGIRSIHNGCQPCAINYNNIRDIISAIRQEKKTIGTVDYETYRKMLNFSNLGRTWLNVNYYKN